MKHALHLIQSEAERVRDAIDMAIRYNTPHFQREAEKAQERFERHFPNEDWRSYAVEKKSIAR